MIRHSSSFLLSLVFHGALLLLLILAWNKIEPVKKVNCESKLSVALSHIICEEALHKPLPSKTPIKPKKIEKPKVKPKPLVKKVVVVQKEPIVVPQEIEEVVEEVVPEVMPEALETQTQEMKSEEVLSTQQAPSELVVEEDPNEKQRRLEQEYLQGHLSLISKLLQENLYYPRRARQRGIVGEVVVKFVLTTQGEVKYLEVLESKSEILSRAAIKTIEKLSGEFPKPDEKLILHIPINYALKK